MTGTNEGARSLLRKRRFLFARLVVVLLAFGPGCAGGRAQARKAAYIDDQTAHFEHARPPQELLAEARRLLEAKGYRVERENSTELQTSWKLIGKMRSRYRIVLKPGARGAGLEAVREEQSQSYGQWSPGAKPRDLEFEWQLLEALEPDDAGRITREADAKALSQS
jgi:hypothetical protein